MQIYITSWGVTGMINLLECINQKASGCFDDKNVGTSGECEVRNTTESPHAQKMLRVLAVHLSQLSSNQRLLEKTALNTEYQNKDKANRTGGSVQESFRTS